MLKAVKDCLLCSLVVCCSGEDRVKALLLFISLLRLHSYMTVAFEMQYPAMT